MDQHFDGSDAHLLVACPKCGRQWLPPCEQTICIERHGECIPCRFVPAGGEINKHGSGEGTKEEIDAISAAAKVGAGETAHNDRVEGRDAALSRRVPSHDGLELTLMDYFACHALTGLLAGRVGADNICDFSDVRGEDTTETDQWAHEAYALAEAMLRAREHKYWKSSNAPHEGPARASCAGPLDAVVGALVPTEK